MENEPPWILLTEAVDLANPDTIVRWCRDGQLESRVQRRVSHIRDYETGSNDTHIEECHTLDPADWTENHLGNPNGSHWQDNDFHFDFSTAPVPFILGMAITGGGFYAIQVRGDQLRERVERRKRSSPIGRRKGSGTLKKADNPLLAEMSELIEKGIAFSPDGAAKLVAKKAVGGGSEESTAARLAKRYRERANE